jgi:hypothetical protein
MGKTGKERKRRRLLQTKTDHVLTDHEDENRVLEYGGIISAEDMNSTLRCLTTLKDHPDLVRSKEFKALRAAVHLVHDSAFAVTGKGMFKRLYSHFTNLSSPYMELLFYQALRLAVVYPML